MKALISLFLLTVVAAPAVAVMRGRDYKGDITVNSIEVGHLIGKKAVRVDVDGDGVKDTLDIYFRQTGYTVSLRDRGEEVFLTFFECGDTNVTLEYARSYLLSPDKPVMLFCYTRPTADGNQLEIVDVVRTADGRKGMSLLKCSAGWADCPVVVKPGYIEMRHFRGWVEAKYQWNGSQFDELPVEP